MTAVHLDVPYPGSTDSRQALDLFLPAAASSDSRLIVFIHGGAWRSESKSDFVDTLMPAFVLHTGLPAACLEYRLAPSHPHPAHISDVIAGLSLLTGPLLDLECGKAKWRRDQLCIVGHSAGAFMAASLVLRPPASSSGSASSWAVPTTVRPAISDIVCVDGIYDLPALLAEYPSYASFVHEAFGSDSAVLARESPARWNTYDDSLSGGQAQALRVTVLHSRHDELLSLRQPRIFLRRLKQLLSGGEARPGLQDAISSEEEVEVEEGDELDLPGNVTRDFDSLTGGHYEVVKGEELAHVLAVLLNESV